MTYRALCALLVLCLAMEVQAQRPIARPLRGPSNFPARPDVGDSVIVGRNRIHISVPRPIIGPRSSVPNVVGFYTWKLEVPGARGFSIVLASDTALRTTAVSSIAPALTLRLCPTPNSVSVRDCTIPLTAQVHFSSNAIRAVITDSALVTRIRQERPLLFLRTSIEPRGRTESAEKLFVYQDR